MPERGREAGLDVAVTSMWRRSLCTFIRPLLLVLVLVRARRRMKTRKRRDGA